MVLDEYWTSPPPPVQCFWVKNLDDPDPARRFQDLDDLFLSKAFFSQQDSSVGQPSVGQPSVGQPSVGQPSVGQLRQFKAVDFDPSNFAAGAFVWDWGLDLAQLFKVLLSRPQSYFGRRINLDWNWGSDQAIRNAVFRFVRDYAYCARDTVRSAEGIYLWGLRGGALNTEAEPHLPPEDHDPEDPNQELPLPAPPPRYILGDLGRAPNYFAQLTEWPSSPFEFDYRLLPPGSPEAPEQEATRRYIIREKNSAIWPGLSRAHSQGQPVEFPPGFEVDNMILANP
jgi:hypothetical protein